MGLESRSLFAVLSNFFMHFEEGQKVSTAIIERLSEKRSDIGSFLSFVWIVDNV